MRRNKLLTIVTMAVAFVCAWRALPVQAQFAYRQTVGNETENQYQPGSFQAIRNRGAIINKPNRTQSNATIGNFTRHSKLGGSTGIGDSTLQTTSVTSESRPALMRPLSISTGTPLIVRPALNLRFESPIDSPALRSFKVQYPGIEEPSLFGRMPEAFTNSSILPSSSNKSFSSMADEFEF